MHNNLYSKDPFGVFEVTNPSLSLGGIPEQNTSLLEKSNAATKSFWLKTIGIFLFILLFGLILHFKDSLFGVLKKKVAQLNDKVNPGDEPKTVEVEILPEPKLLNGFIEKKIECLFLIDDKPNWDIPYINAKIEEKKIMQIK